VARLGPVPVAVRRLRQRRPAGAKPTEVGQLISVAGFDSMLRARQSGGGGEGGGAWLGPVLVAVRRLRQRRPVRTEPAQAGTLSGAKCLRQCCGPRALEAVAAPTCAYKTSIAAARGEREMSVRRAVLHVICGSIAGPMMRWRGLGRFQSLSDGCGSADLCEQNQQKWDNALGGTRYRVVLWAQLLQSSQTAAAASNCTVATI
jgi:hypothetical protein